MLLLRIFTLSTIFFCTLTISAQTCCTAGAPVSSFYGVQTGVKNSWAFNLAYEYKAINLLIDENTQLVNDPRTRSGQSLSAKVDYILNKKWSFSASVPLIFQSRKTVSARERSIGIGDLLLVSQYQLFNKNDFSFRLSGGLKLPIGQQSHQNADAIFLSPDMQSGSGSVDWIAQVTGVKEHFIVPFLTTSVEVSYRDNGINSSFGKTPDFGGRRFGFGDQWVAMLTFNYQWITSLGNFVPDLNLRYRNLTRNVEQTTVAPNSGGSWLSLPLGIAFQPDPQKSMRIYAEFPLSQDLNGLQITTSFTACLQFRYILSRKNK